MLSRKLQLLWTIAPLLTIALCETTCAQSATEAHGLIQPTSATAGESTLKHGATAKQQQLRQQLQYMLGIPQDRVPLAAEKRGDSQDNGVVIERWIFTSEPGSQIPAVLYRPKTVPQPMPAIVFTYGHGGSKGHWSYNYAGLLYARLGIAVLAMDPIGEEERHPEGQAGTRQHDDKQLDARAWSVGRPMLGKLVFDAMRGIDFLLERKDVDPDRIGVVGNSLGGAGAAWMAALDPRLRMAIVSGWAYDDVLQTSGKSCTTLPTQRMREICTWSEFAALSAPHCAVLVMNGDADWIIDRKEDGSAWTGTQWVASEANEVFSQSEAIARMECWFEPDGGHRPYFAYKDALLWMHRYLGTPEMTDEEIKKLPVLSSGRWCDAHGIDLGKLYGVPLHERGASLADLKLVPTPREKLRCLKPDEVGSSQFTIAGWLDVVAASSKQKQ